MEIIQFFEVTFTFDNGKEETVTFKFDTLESLITKLSTRGILTVTKENNELIVIDLEKVSFSKVKTI